ncbi:MAG TPA: DUF302 domain-containing protein [Acidocella sp.]|uniref:DUF302 domain-containing protein n=1 Tax=Acidocella sp. TaxID=50710 RepID=UPI002CBB3523|nr:DUF302 domain-containing protein [Acidocella sp.]HVE21424.1 DUF302 domain-containing protein [Acidocella sp.]
MPDTGLVTLQSAHDFDATVRCLAARLDAKGVTVFARVDHAAGAVSVGMVLRPTTLFMFGNPAAGTPLMQAAQHSGIDLPLKMLVWQDANGMVYLSYNDPSWIAARHGLAGGVQQTVTGMTETLDALAQHAASTAGHD